MTIAEAAEMWDISQETVKNKLKMSLNKDEIEEMLRKGLVKYYQKPDGKRKEWIISKQAMNEWFKKEKRGQLSPLRRKIMKFKAWDKIDKRWIYDEQEFIPLMVTNKGVFKLSPHHKENLWILADRERFDIFPYSEEDYKEGN